MSKNTINLLIVLANPRGTNSLRLGTEDRVIRQSLKLSRYRDNLSATFCHAATVHDLRRALLEDDYHIVHISGHGTDSGLVLEDDLGEPNFIPPAGLSELFKAYSPPIRCVILNACYSISQGELISMEVPFTIGMEGAISDVAAIEFSRGFYDAIGAGREIDFAYDEGCRTVKLAAPNTQFISKILKNTQHELVSIESTHSPKPEQLNLCVVDIGSVSPPSSSIGNAEVRFSITNLSGQIIKLTSITLEILAAEVCTQIEYPRVAAPIDEYFLHARLNPSTNKYELLTQHHEIRERTEGFFLKIDAAEGFTYTLQLNILWNFLGGQRMLISSSPFKITFPVQSAEGLLRLAEESSRD
jgi:Uncharacterized protein conserved in bacteria